MNVVILCMARCGSDWVGDIIKYIYERLYGKELKIHYENDRGLISNEVVEGWHNIYNVDPKILLKLGYDKILIIKRPLEVMKQVHALHHGYIEEYESYEHMQRERPGFFKKIELYHDLIYNQQLDPEKVLIVNLEDLNKYTHSIFEEIINFLGFKLSLLQKIKLLFRILRNKVRPFVVPCKAVERDWEVYSTMLPKGHEVCDRLKIIEKLKKNEVEICQML